MPVQGRDSSYPHRSIEIILFKNVDGKEIALLFNIL